MATFLDQFKTPIDTGINTYGTPSVPSTYSNLFQQQPNLLQPQPTLSGITLKTPVQTTTAPSGINVNGVPQTITYQTPTTTLPRTTDTGGTIGTQGTGGTKVSSGTTGTGNITGTGTTPVATAPRPAAYNPLTGQPLLVGQTVTKDGITYTGTAQGAPVPPPGSPAAIAQGTGFTFQQTPEEIAAEKTRAEAQGYLESGFQQNLDPQEIYKNQLSQYQSQIDAINNIYADQLAQARVQGQGRIESRQFAQGRAGQIGSGTGEAGINAVQEGNRQVENAIMAEKANAIAGIMGKVRTGAAEDLTAKTKAKKEGADAILAEGIASKERKAKRLKDTIAGLVSQNINIADMTPEELKSFTNGLNITEDQLKREFNTQRQATDLAATKAKQEEEKRQLDLQKTQAEIANKEKETSLLGKMTPYQAAQLSIERQRLAKESVTNQQYTQAAVQQMSNIVESSSDTNGFLTPSQYKQARKQWISETGLPPASFDAYFADKAYTQDVDKESPYSLATYGISKVAEKTLPTVGE